MTSGDARVHADPERSLHDDVGVREIADDAMRNVAIGGLAQEVAGEELPRCDAAAVQPLHELTPTERRVGPNGQRETEPARIAVLALRAAARTRATAPKGPRAVAASCDAAAQ